jgi:hypothetical protein
MHSTQVRLIYVRTEYRKKTEKAVLTQEKLLSFVKVGGGGT